jgi:thiol-disulfide isomerase/thioredoxin
VQNIILCPRCRRQIKPDNLGERICLSCNLRLCPKAHIVDGKICTYCGWEDPNYSLWQKVQKDRLHRPRSKAQEESTEVKTQYICPNCGVTIGSIRSRCPNCGWLGVKSSVDKALPAAAMSTAAKPVTPVKSILDSIPREAKQKKVREYKSNFVKEVAAAERTHWQPPPLRNFVRPILASTLAGIVVLGLVFGGIYAARFISQKIESVALPPIIVVEPSKTYTLSTSTVPQGSGEIRITPPPSTNGAYELGSQVTLTAIPADCYSFGYWDGIASPTDNVTIPMDSDKTITANFKPKDTTPPVISQVKADSYSDVSATISWLTDIPATSQVDYGKTKEYGLSAVSDEGLTTDHKVRITGLQPNTTYYFLVKSADKCGAEAKETKMIATAREITYGEKVGQRAIDFTLPYYDDDNPESPNNSGSETLSNYIGKKKILINFWSTYCGACIGEFPYIRDIYEDVNFADSNSANSDFLVFTICIDSKIEEAPARIETIEAKFIDEAGAFTFPILMDSVAQTKKDYHVWTIPETVFIDSDGIIRQIKIGRFKDIEEIKTILNSLN